MGDIYGQWSPFDIWGGKGGVALYCAVWDKTH